MDPHFETPGLRKRSEMPQRASDPIDDLAPAGGGQHDHGAVQSPSGVFVADGRERNPPRRLRDPPVYRVPVELLWHFAAVGEDMPLVEIEHGGLQRLGQVEAVGPREGPIELQPDASGCELG